ncbi:alpha-1,4-glucan--maltose-1-phosphate maltosyltransferase [Paeniglutamicibacter cryotolerans]
MSPGAQGLDTWHATVRPGSPGLWEFSIEAWDHPYATWMHDATIKIDTGIDTALMLAEGAALFTRAASAPGLDAADRSALLHIAQRVGDDRLNPVERLAAGTSSAVEAIFERTPLRQLLTTSPRYPILVERRAAGYGAWYEFFPRSEGAVYDRGTKSYASGTFRTAAKRLEAVAAMGFDVILLPPIHPIGRTRRAGPNDTPVAGPHDPGSPWAVGSADGGHDAFHPDLGGEADFAFFVDSAWGLGLEVALDLALQASPDHPWVAEHSEWFTTRADGSIAYAENPPKKYRGVYPLNFDHDPAGLSAEVLRIVLLWIDRGVRIFRVDDADAKPLWFWQWLIGRISVDHPDVVFMAAAPASPAVVQALGKAGFQQCSGHFATWNTKAELESNFREAAGDSSAFSRQNFFVSTPDTLTGYVQFGGLSGSKVRAVLAAMASPLWGMYAGYELFEHVARPGSAEHLDSEKYEYKPRDFAAAEVAGRSLAPYITLLNGIRRDHPALSTQRNLTIHCCDDDAVMVFSKSRARHAGEPADTVIVVVNLDPHTTREATVSLDLRALGLEADEPGEARTFAVRDLVGGQQWRWGEHNYVCLGPRTEPAYILHVVGDGR